MSIKSFIKYPLRLFYLFRATSFKGVSTKAEEDVIWVYIWGVPYIFSDEMVFTCAIINALSRRNIKFNIKWGKKIGETHNKRIFFVCSRGYDPFGFKDYTSIVRFFCQQLEQQNCQVYPSLKEVSYWENKAHMHQKFDELKISSPRTKLFNNANDLINSGMKYPFLIKEEHSRSSNGLYKIESQEDIFKVIDAEYFQRNKVIIAQDLINIRRDLRVILVGDKIVHHYWRINLSKEWKPTATSFGSEVDFVSFPEKWRKFIIDEFKKLDLVTGAFDVAWQNDDTETTPLILEVSPYYQPNPSVDVKKLGMSYGEYKKKLTFKDSYDKRFVKTVFSIHESYIDWILSRQENLIHVE